MKTAKCKGCGRSVFSAATLCPGCGIAQPVDRPKTFKETLDDNDVAAGRKAGDTRLAWSMFKWFMGLLILSLAAFLVLLPGCVERKVAAQLANSCYQEGRAHGKHLANKSTGLSSVLTEAVDIVDYCRREERINPAPDCYDMCKEGITNAME